MSLIKNRISQVIGAITLISLFGLGCAQDKKGSSTTTPVPITTNPYYPNCTPGVANCYQQPGTLGVPAQAYPYGAGACAAGQVYTAYNCLPIAGCPANHGMYNNQCVPAMAINTNGFPNGYNMQNGYWGSYYNSYPYYNGMHPHDMYTYSNPYGSPSYYYSGYPYGANLGYGFSLWLR